MIATLALTLLLQGQAGKQPALPIELEKDRKPSIVTKGNCIIRGGRVITVTGPDYPKADVLVKDGKIAAIGENLGYPAGTTVIDATGKVVIPGIIDAHSHMASDEVNESSDAIVAEVNIADILNPESDSVYRRLTSGQTVALVLHGSANPIGGESNIIKMRWNKPLEQFLMEGAPRVIKFALGENVKRSGGDDPQTRFPATRMGVEAVYRRAFADAREYINRWAQYEEARKTNPSAVQPRRDMRLQTLADILQGKIIVHCHSYRQDEMLMMLRLSQEYGFKLKCLQHALEGYKIAPEIAAAGVGVSAFSDAWAYKFEVYDAIAYNVAICINAGVVASINTDSFSGSVPLTIDSAKTIRFGGLTPAEAIKTVTINPAIQLGIENRVGSLEVGKDADIAIFDGHPLSVYSRCAMTLVDGEVYFQRRDAWGIDKTSTISPDVPVPSAAQPALPPSTASLVAIVGGTVHPVTGPAVANGTVLLRDGKIAAVGANVSVPEGAAVFDAKGLHVYPGLIDASTDIGRTEIGSVRATIDVNEIGQFQPDLIAAHAVYPDSEIIPVSRFGGLTTALTRSANLPIAGQASIINLAGYTWEEMTVRPRAALMVSFPEGPPAMSDEARARMNPDTLQTLRNEQEESIEALRQYFERARRYGIARKEDPARTPPDVRLEAMQPYLAGQLPVIVSAGSADSVRRAIKFAEEQKLKLVLRSTMEPFRVAKLIAEKGIPMIIDPSNVAAGGGGSSMPSRDYYPYDTRLALPALLHRAGVKFCFSSEGAASSYELRSQAGMACAFGLPKDVALRAMTINSAEILGVSDLLGSLEPGKIGNVIVLDGDPFEITTSVRGLFINGRSVPLESRWTRLRDKYMPRIAKG